jgi:biopolymer transport protein ExbB
MGVSAAPSRTRLVAFILGCLLAVYLYAFAAPVWQAARAQQDQPPPGDQPQAQPQEPEHETTIGNFAKMVIHMIKSVGLVMGFVLLVLSIALVFLIVLLVMDLRMGDSVPPAFVEEFTETVNKRRFKEAFEMARTDNSFLAKVLSVGMARLQYGIEDAREAALNTVESIKAGKEQLITYLSTIGTLGPLFGLVGTVYSMIGAFMKMSDPNKQVDPHEMAGILSHGLVVTLLGIALAVPAIFCHAFFRNRLIKIANEVSNVADDLLTQMYHNSKKPAAAPVAAPHADARAAAVTAKPAE